MRAVWLIATWGRRRWLGRYGGEMESFTDDELAELALSADPDAPIADDAVPFGQPEHDRALLPEWYMPAPSGVRRTRPRMLAVSAIIASLILVNGAGLCVTYGLPEIAW
jgi:hypothetical protein